MTWLKREISESGLSGKSFAMSQAYARWEIDQVVAEELARNLCLSAACVAAATLALLADARSSALVLACVGATLVDVCGFAHFWGLSVDVVVGINVVVSVGLCVDFAAHVAHVFLTQTGGRDHRKQQAHKALVVALTGLPLRRSRANIWEIESSCTFWDTDDYALTAPIKLIGAP